MKCKVLLGALLACICQVAAADDRQPALRQLGECVNANIVRLDDGISPAAEVARAIALACQTEVADFAAAVSIQEGHSELGFIHDITKSYMNGQMFLTNVLEHRTASASSAKTPAKDEGVNTNNQLIALCSDPPQTLGHTVCLAYLRGWIDAYPLANLQNCRDTEMTANQFRDAYLELIARPRMQRVQTKSPGGVLAAIMDERSHPCKKTQ